MGPVVVAAVNRAAAPGIIVDLQVFVGAADFLKQAYRPPSLFYFSRQLQGIAGLVGAVDHDDAVRSGHEAKVAPPDLGFHEHIAGKLLHEAPPLSHGPNDRNLL